MSQPDSSLRQEFDLLDELRGRPGPEILTSHEARTLLRIGRTKLWELTKTCEIPAYRTGPGKTSSLRYKRSDLIRWLENNRIGG